MRAVNKNALFIKRNDGVPNKKRNVNVWNFVIESINMQWTWSITYIVAVLPMGWFMRPNRVEHLRAAAVVSLIVAEPNIVVLYNKIMTLIVMLWWSCTVRKLASCLRSFSRTSQTKLKIPIQLKNNKRLIGFAFCEEHRIIILGRTWRQQ